MAVDTTYKFLEHRPASNYRQLFVRGRSLRAEILYRATLGSEPRTLEEVADDYGVPLEAVAEAVHYCQQHEALLCQERHEVLAISDGEDWIPRPQRRILVSPTHEALSRRQYH